MPKPVKSATSTTTQPRRGRTSTRAANSGPTEEQIRRRAYELYLERGASPGADISDWLRAEQELRAVAGRK